MANPAFKQTGDRFASSGAFGSSAFGTAPYGGQDYNPEDLPTYHLGSDDLTKTHHKRAAEVTHARMGVPVSVRLWQTWDRWRVNINTMSEADMVFLKSFFALRTFDFCPTGSTDNSIPVRWVEPEFAPTYLAPDQYSLSFEIEEIPA